MLVGDPFALPKFKGIKISKKETMETRALPDNIKASRGPNKVRAYNEGHHKSSYL